MRQRPLCFTRKTVEVLPFASSTVAVALASSGTSMFWTSILVSGENRLSSTSVAQLPLADDSVTELDSLGVKIWLQIRSPSPSRLAVWRSDMTCRTASSSELPEPPPPRVANTATARTAITRTPTRPMSEAVHLADWVGSPPRTFSR